jgi:murein L,D-transpeptidase YafK
VNGSSRRRQAGSRQTLAQAAIAICAAAAAASYALAIGVTPAPISRHVATPEAMLVRALLDIRDSKFSSAVDNIDSLLASNPNFRLAQLVKGDLLMARTRPLDSIGNAAGASAEQVAGLRDEARIRMVRSQIEPSSDLVPRYLLQMPAKEKLALVLDSTKSTLFVFENTGKTPHYVADYYVTIGKNGTDKYKEGDKKTPLGVYYVTGHIPREKLTATYGKQSELYGTGAMPLSYPNEWDRREGRNGSGIWLHGVPFDTYSRPPRASDGCVALTNEDFEVIAKYTKAGVTPVIIAQGIEWTAANAAKTLRGQLAQSIEGWRRDWESLDTDKYLTHYAPGFSSGKMDLAQWSEQKRGVNAGKTWIKLKVDKLSVFLYPGRDDLAVVSFDQDYASSNLSNVMRKRQYWIREGNSWRILYEGSA